MSVSLTEELRSAHSKTKLHVQSAALSCSSSRTTPLVHHDTAGATAAIFTPIPTRCWPLCALREWSVRGEVGRAGNAAGIRLSSGASSISKNGCLSASAGVILSSGANSKSSAGKRGGENHARLSG